MSSKGTGVSNGLSSGSLVCSPQGFGCTQGIERQAFLMFIGNPFGFILSGKLGRILGTALGFSFGGDLGSFSLGFFLGGCCSSGFFSSLSLPSLFRFCCPLRGS
ncbi:hypothetical protein C5U62_32900 [Pseudomonas protegens]|uniref:Uncharacterized protein n=1 Tax=Pseudomonas protegens TaxID=380021 RepID=A0A2T6GAT6_9PSED|nr:hypothetical protein C5U62_32900 [Pseudomonas protegens]